MSTAAFAAAAAAATSALAMAELLGGVTLPGALTAIMGRLSALPVGRRLRRERISLNVASALLGSLIAYLVTAGMPARLPALLVPVGAAAGFAAPNLWTARRLRKRLDEALRELPDMLDLLGVTLAAGLPPIRALSTVAAEFSGPLALEWRRVGAEVELGLPRDRAFAALAARLPDHEVRSFAEAFARSHRHGTPLARVLAAQATRARHGHAQRMREQGARAGPRIQLVVALLLVPSALLVVVAGLVAELGRAGIAGIP
jgi:tight adherence protein C